MKHEKYCQAMNSFGLWENVSLYHDGTKNNYAEETYDLFCNDLKNGLTAWKKVRLISRNGEVFKEQDNVFII